jgi:hypothetical protein
MFQKFRQGVEEIQDWKKTHFLIESANEIVGWFLVQELQDITCV